MSGFDGRSVLVVDDEPDVRALVAASLAVDGWSVLEAEDQAQTLAAVGGRIVLMAEGGETRVAGRLDASAPAALNPEGGDGGFIETSANTVRIADTATITSAAAASGKGGRTGTWLIDPTNLTIAASGGDITGATLGGQLGANNVTLATSAAGGGNGDILVNDTVTWSKIGRAHV